MTEQELLDRIAKKEEQIKKIEKRIAKWEAKNNVQGFIKEQAQWYTRDPKSVKTFDDLVKLRNEFDPNGDGKKWMDSSFAEYQKDCEREIRYAKSDLEDAQNTVNKYKAQIADKQEKGATEKIPAIVEFLNEWRRRVEEFVRTEGLQSVKEYYEADHNYFEVKYQRKSSEEEIREARDARELAKFRMDPLSLSVYHRGKINEDELKKVLDRDIENKYWNLVNRIKEKAGDIVDASHLSVGAKGDLNGIVTGSEHTVRVETIPAAGYNIQRFHYRTLVHVIK